MRTLFVIVAFALILLAAAYFVIKTERQSVQDPVSMDGGWPASKAVMQVSPPLTSEQKLALAKCLKSKEVKLYSTWWCYYCKKQKQAFGDAAAAHLPVVDCSSPGKHDRLKVCEDAGVDAYPTWVIPNGPTIPGYVEDLRLLAKASGCSL